MNDYTKRSGKDVAKVSDRLCMQYGLSVINERQSRKEYSSYGAWKKENDNQNRTPSLRQKLQFAIDEVLELKPKSLEEFLGAMKNLGYENKVGEHIAFRFKGNKKFLRLRSLDDEYSQENILKQLEEFADGELSRDGDLKTEFEVEVAEDDDYSEPTKMKVADEIVFLSSQTHLDFEKSSEYKPISNFDNIQLEEPRAVKENPFSLGALKKIKSEIKQPRRTTRQIQTTNNKDMSLLLDLQRIKMQGKGTGYERWARRFNTNQLAKTISFINENGLTSYKNLKMKSDKILNQQEQLKNDIRDINSKLNKIRELKSVIIKYSKTKSVFEQYRKTGYSEKFKQEHLQDILEHRDAKKVFEEVLVGMMGSFQKWLT